MIAAEAFLFFRVLVGAHSVGSQRDGILISFFVIHKLETINSKPAG